MLSKVEIAKKLLEINAIRLDPSNPFIWASGMRSPIYCDNRLTLSYPYLRSQLIESMAEMSAQFGEFEKIAGVATAGIAHGALLAERLSLPFLYVRSSAKGHGRKNQIEGILRKGESCLVVEDLISTGGSSIKAVDAIENAGGIVKGVVAIFTYQLQKAKDNFDKAGCSYATLSDFSSLLQAAEEDQKLTSENLHSLKEWYLNPQSWSDNFLAKMKCE